MKHRLLTLLVLLSSLAVWPVVAQITGAITGNVLDASAAVVVKANVVIRNSATGAERKIETDGNGRFLAEALPIGVYEVTVTPAGFKKAVRNGLQLEVADRLAVEGRLQGARL